VCTCVRAGSSATCTQLMNMDMMAHCIDHVNMRVLTRTHTLAHTHTHTHTHEQGACHSKTGTGSLRATASSRTTCPKWKPYTSSATRAARTCQGSTKVREIRRRSFAWQSELWLIISRSPSAICRSRSVLQLFCTSERGYVLSLPCTRYHSAILCQCSLSVIAVTVWLSNRRLHCVCVCVCMCVCVCVCTCLSVAWCVNKRLEARPQRRPGPGANRGLICMKKLQSRKHAPFTFLRAFSPFV